MGQYRNMVVVWFDYGISLIGLYTESSAGSQNLKAVHITLKYYWRKWVIRRSNLNFHSPAQLLFLVCFLTTDSVTSATSHLCQSWWTVLLNHGTKWTLFPLLCKMFSHSNKKVMDTDNFCLENGMWSAIERQTEGL